MATVHNIVGWIIDTSIECDHQRIEGFLKVSLEDVIIALRDDAHLLDDPDGILSGWYHEEVFDEAGTSRGTTLYPNGFSASRLLEIIDGEEFWTKRQFTESERFILN